MDHLKYQKYRNKRLENNFEPVNLSINDMDKLKKKQKKQRREYLQKTFGIIGTIR